MKVEEIPFNMTYYFDASLRERPVSYDEMSSGVQFLKEQLSMCTKHEQYIRLCGLIGVYSRILNNPSESEAFLTKAIQSCEQSNELKTMFANQLRLAHTYHWKEDYHKANQLFQELIDTLDNNPSLELYRDFLYQHYGKCRLDQGDVVTARFYFQLALSIRKQKGDLDLISSTKKAIQYCQEMKKRVSQ